VELAELAGNPTIASQLLAAGATKSSLEPVGEFIAAALQGDGETVSRLRAEHPNALDEAKAARPGVIVWAAAGGRKDAVALLIELGFDVNALARGDIPSDQPWQTALHEAAYEGDLALAQLLLDNGADPNIRDARFDSTPLGWAEHADQQAMIELLRPATS